MPSELIDTSESLAALLAADHLVHPEVTCAIDTEADSLHRYRESLCLVQFAAGNDCRLIDPLAIDDLSPLGGFLLGATVWMHGADYDMTMLKRQFGDLPEQVFDTQIGARLLGARRFGLADLVLEYFGVELSKSSQKADWGRRPLTPKMVDYALNDVRFLLPMADQIVDRLHHEGRRDWFLESCTAARRKVLEREESREEAWRIQGCGKFDPYALACLRALWHWRDREAELWDRPTFMVATNRQLIEWSTDLARKHKIALPKHFRSDRVKRFRQMIETLEQLPESAWPTRPKSLRRKRDRDFERRVDALLKTREKAAESLNIEGALIASRATLESIAANEADPAETLLSWQLALMGFTS